MAKVEVVKVTDPGSREQAVKVIEAVFLKEKKWVDSAEGQFPPETLNSQRFSWFLAYCNGYPAGLLRLYYDPPLEMPSKYRVTFKGGIDIEALKRKGRFVEVGRFMILPRFRRNFRVAIRLMRAGIKEVVMRNYTHFITDVYKGEKHSPYLFHTRILGFEVIGTHLYGELNCSCTRLILTLDILKAYERLKDQSNRSVIYNALLKDVSPLLEKKLGSRA